MKKLSILLLVAAVFAAILTAAAPASADVSISSIPARVIRETSVLDSNPGRPIAAAHVGDGFAIVKTEFASGIQWAYGDLWRNQQKIVDGWIPLNALQLV